MLRAPIDGRVSGLSVSEGNEIKQGQIVARIVDDSRYKINAKLYPDEYANIKLGQELAVRFSIFDGTYYCTVTDINLMQFLTAMKKILQKDLYIGLLSKEKSGLVQPGIKVQLGLPAANANSGVLWFASSSKVDGFVDEQKSVIYS